MSSMLTSLCGTGGVEVLGELGPALTPLTLVGQERH